MGLINDFRKWKGTFESKGLKVNFWKSKLMFSGDIMEYGLSESKVYTCGVSSLRVSVNSVLCVVWLVDQWWMCCSDEGDFKVFSKFCIQEM